MQNCKRTLSINTVSFRSCFIERHSICQVVILFPLFKKVSRVVFHRATNGYGVKSSSVVRLVEYLVRLANKRIVIEQLPIEKVLSYEWKSNKKAAVQIRSHEESLANSFACRVAKDVIDDRRIIKYFQGELTRSVSRKLQYQALCDDFRNDKESWVFIAESAEDENVEDYCSSICIMFLRSCRVVAQYVRMLGYMVVSLFIPLGYLALRVRRGFSQKKELPKYDVAVPVMWGFHEDGGSIHGGMRKRQDDTFLYDERIKPGRVVHIFGKWAFSSEDKQSYKKYMDSHGLAYADSAQFRLTTNFMRIVMRTQWNLIKGIFSNLRWFQVDRTQCTMMQMLPKLLYYYLEKLLELEHLWFRAELVRDDYNAGHVINSLVCRKHDIQTLGIQHTASPYDAPQLAFVEFDRYCSYGKLYEKLFSPFWDEQQIVQTGREGLDWVIEIFKDHQYIEVLKKRMRDLYQDRGHTVVILFPGIAERCLISRWKEIYKGLELVQELDVDANVFMRFRSMEHLEYEYTRCFKELAEKDSRFILDHENFITQDLIAVSDLIITPNASLGINEGTAVDKKVLTFDFTNTATLYFDGYGDDFVMTSAEQVKQAFIGLETDFQDIDCDWDELKTSLNHHVDGKNCERLRDAIEDMIADNELAVP